MLMLRLVAVYLSIGAIAATMFHRYCRKAFDVGVAVFVTTLWPFMAAGVVKGAVEDIRKRL